MRLKSIMVNGVRFILIRYGMKMGSKDTLTNTNYVKYYTNES
jgi:hypothetical protein